MDIYCQVTPSGLVPMYDSDAENKAKLRNGEQVLCTIKRPRNIAFHRKFFALVRLTYFNLPEHLMTRFCIHNEEDMLARFKIDLGLFDIVDVGEGRALKLGSISFAKMDNTEFESFYNQCLDLVQHVYLEGADRADILEEVDKFR